MNFILTVLALCFCVTALPVPGFNLNVFRSDVGQVKHYEKLIAKSNAKLVSASEQEKTMLQARIKAKTEKQQAIIKRLQAEDWKIAGMLDEDVGKIVNKTPLTQKQKADLEVQYLKNLENLKEIFKGDPAMTRFYDTEINQFKEKKSLS